MKAIGHNIYGEADVLQFMDVPEPTMRENDLLVKVYAFAVNPVDTQWRRGEQSGAPVENSPQILGWDAAGVVTKVGKKVHRFKIGDEVYFAGDVTRQGCYAEFTAIDERIVAKKPKSLSFTESAALPLTALTAWEALFENMGIQIAPNQSDSSSVPSLLIVGGAGGVGSIAIQIAKRVAGLRVIATASHTSSKEFCRKLGADEVIDHKQDFSLQLQALGKGGADFILNTSSSLNFSQLIKTLNPLGKICTIAGENESFQTLDIDDLFRKRVTLTFELMFTRPRLDFQPEKQGQILSQIADLIDQKTLFSTMTQVLDWQDIQKAHRLIETGHSLGKIVLNVIK